MSFHVQFIESLKRTETAREGLEAQTSDFWRTVVLALTHDGNDNFMGLGDVWGSDDEEVETLDKRIKALEDLIEGETGQKAGKFNAYRSAKSVFKTACALKICTLEEEAEGSYTVDENGDPLPRGKTAVQKDIKAVKGAKDSFTRIKEAIEAASKVLHGDDREPLTAGQLTELKDAAALLFQAIEREESYHVEDAPL